MNSVVRLVLLATLICWGSSALSDPKQESEELLSAVVPFAESMLREHGEFYPFGAAQRLEDGSIVSVGASNGQEHPQSADLINLLKAAFREGADSRQFRATALVYDSRVVDPSTNERTDAIAVSIDHVQQYSVVVFFPYRIERGEPLLGTPFAQEGERAIFARQ